MRTSSSWPFTTKQAARRRHSPPLRTPGAYIVGPLYNKNHPLCYVKTPPVHTVLRGMTSSYPHWQLSPPSASSHERRSVEIYAGLSCLAPRFRVQHNFGQPAPLPASTPNLRSPEQGRAWCLGLFYAESVPCVAGSERRANSASGAQRQVVCEPRSPTRISLLRARLSITHKRRACRN